MAILAQMYPGNDLTASVVFAYKGPELSIAVELILIGPVDVSGAGTEALREEVNVGLSYSQGLAGVGPILVTMAGARTSALVPGLYNAAIWISMLPNYAGLAARTYNGAIEVLSPIPDPEIINLSATFGVL